MAWTRKRGKAYLAVWRSPDGVERSRGGFTTRKAAMAYATDAERKRTNFDPHAGKVLFRAVAAEWLNSRHDLKATTRAAYAEALAPTTDATAKRHGPLTELRIDAVFGGYPINAIRREQISDWVARMIAAGKRPSTVRNAYFLVRQVLGQAVADGLIDSNPADYVKLPTDYTTGTAAVHDVDGQYLTAAQVEALTDAMPWPLNVYVHLAAWSGLRAGELAGLQVGDVGRNALHVQRTVARVGRNLEYLTPKTKGSQRTVPLPPHTAALLRDYLTHHPGKADPSAPLFPNVRLSVRLHAPRPTGGKVHGNAPTPAQRAQRQLAALADLTVPEHEARLVLDWSAPLRHTTFYKAVYRPAVLRAGLPTALRFHALRHTYASLCVAAGIPMFDVSRFMGHAKPSTTETVYAHLLNTDDHAGAMAALGAMATPKADNVVRLHG